MISVLVPSFNDDLLSRLFLSMEQSEPGSVQTVIVGDNGISDAFKEQWPQAMYVHVPKPPFIAAQAINLCAAAAPPESDLVVCNDDVEILTWDWAQRIERYLAWGDLTGYGMVTMAAPTTKATYGSVPGPLDTMELHETATGPMLVIPRHVWNIIGPWDERYVGYGFEDFDYCLRLFHAGYKFGLSGAVMVRTEGTVGYQREYGSYEAVIRQQDVNFELFHKKWYGQVPEKPWTVRRLVASEHLWRARCACLTYA